MDDKPPRLKRNVSTLMLTLYGIGNIVGAGVYVLVGKIAEPAGYLSIVAFLAAALVAFFAALSYAELAARFPQSAGVSVYLYQAFKNRKLSTVIGLFLVGAGIVSSATLLKGFAGYFVTLVPILPALAIGGAALVLLGVTLRGIKESVGLAALLTIIEVGGLLFLVGAILWAQPDAFHNFADNFGAALTNADSAAWMGVVAATFIAFYAFIGFEDMVNIAEEVKNPRKAFPRAILISILAVTVLYIVVAVATLGVLAPAVLGESSAPLAETFTAATGKTAGVIVVISLLATLNGVIVNIIMGSRFLYGMSRNGWITQWFSRLSGYHVPARGLVLVMAIAVMAALAFPVEKLAQTTSFLLLIVFLAVNASLIAIRRRDSQKNTHAGSKQISPTFVPWVGAVGSTLLIVGQGVTLITAG